MSVLKNLQDVRNGTRSFGHNRDLINWDLETSNPSTLTSSLNKGEKNNAFFHTTRRNDGIFIRKLEVRFEG